MKVAVCLLFAFLALWQVESRTLPDSSSSEEQGKLDSGEESCMNELKIDRKKMLRFNSEDEVSPEDLPEFNSFMQCYGVKQGFLNNDGTVDFNGIAEKLMKEIEAEDSGSKDELAQDVFRRIVMKAADECKSNTPTDADIKKLISESLQCMRDKVDEGAKKFIED